MFSSKTVEISKSFGSLRELVIHPKVRSTPHRWGKTAQPFGLMFSEILTVLPNDKNILFFPISRQASRSDGLAAYILYF